MAKFYVQFHQQSLNDTALPETICGELETCFVRTHSVNFKCYACQHVMSQYVVKMNLLPLNRQYEVRLLCML